MSEKNTGGPAFPWGEHGSHLGGMTLRDYYAGKAMQGMFASFKHWPTMAEIESVAGLAHIAADAMLKAREA